MQHEYENRRGVLMELMSSVLTDISNLMNAGKITQATKLIEAFEKFPSLVSGNLEVKTEDFCIQYVIAYDSQYQGNYVQKILMCSYKFPELMEKMKEVYPEGFYKVAADAPGAMRHKSLHDIFAGLNMNLTDDACDCAG